MRVLVTGGAGFVGSACLRALLASDNEAFAFDKSNPNAGHNYHQPPPRMNFGLAPQLRDGTSRTADGR